MATTTEPQTRKPFWDTIADQIEQLTTAATAGDVMHICDISNSPLDDDGMYGAPAFFAGSGGDLSVLDALRTAGWHVTWADAPYYYVIAAPDGTKITYIEGDIYEGDTVSAAV